MIRIRSNDDEVSESERHLSALSTDRSVDRFVLMSALMFAPMFALMFISGVLVLSSACDDSALRSSPRAEVIAGGLAPDEVDVEGGDWGESGAGTLGAPSNTSSNDTPHDTPQGQREREISLSPASLARLSREEVYETVYRVFGVTATSPLEADTRLHGFARIASAELSLSPLYVEQLEQLAWEVADRITGLATEPARDPEQLMSLFPCDRDERCVQAALLKLGRQAWRRPLSEGELTALMRVYQQVSSRSGDPELSRREALGALIAALIQAPDFIFRVETGEPDPPGAEQTDERLELAGRALTLRGPTWRYTDHEMASRLAYLLWGGPPDERSLEAASAGELTTRDGLRAHAERMLADPRAASRLAGFFDELIRLPDLDAVSKSATLFPEFSPELINSMRAEVRALFRDVVFTRDADVRELLTNERAYIDQALALLYGVTPPAGLADGERFEVTLPADQARGGLLGRAALLTLFSHATVNSPTFRGKFVRGGLLCQDIPPPPEGVVTELESDDGEPKTLRERLERHATDPACVGCHQLMDPLGFPLERFDPIGRWRELDNGLQIDTTGELDGVIVNDARELGAAVANSPYYADCLTRKLYRYAVGHLETDGELSLVEALTDHLTGAGDYRLRDLILEVILSPGFRRLAPPTDFDGGAGEPIMSASVERCDGVDQDQDGVIDEGLIQTCGGSCDRLGVQRCVDGDWGACELSAPPEERCDGQDNDCDGEVDEEVETLREVCDGEDNDCDGAVDEALSASGHEVSYDELSALHPQCQSPSSDQGDCNAAINRFCQALGCGGSGFGPVELGPWSAHVICVPRAQAQVESVAYSDLAARHEVCDAQREAAGPNCNAAIHRRCRDTGRTTGFGPIEKSATHAFVACVPQAEVVHTTYTELSTYHETCQANGERIGAHCAAAINRLCRARGHLSGWGPLENSQDIAVIACVD